MPPTTETDQTHLARAIELARRGRGRTSPNPLVGAVVVQGGEVVGEGWHALLGGPHAEVAAIADAGDTDLHGATMYVSLEPCCHDGRTPPCTDAIATAGISRVVVGSDDPTEKASGRGLGILRDEGIEVVVAEGELTATARLLNQAFRKHARTGRPWVLFKSAMTLDGKVATETGDSKWISSSASRELAHRWRAGCDAVAVGIGTALADNPQLTARIPDVTRQPRRVVFDTTARLPVESKLVQMAPEVPLTVVVSRAARRTAVDPLENAGAEVIVATGANEPDRVNSALLQLGAAGITSILLEGGPHLAGAFYDAGEVDEVRLFLAPIVMGGRTARDPLEGEGTETIAGAMRGLTLDCERVATTCWLVRGCENGESMFTGLVQDRGHVEAVDETAEGVRLRVRTVLGADLAEGDSVAVRGVCLTAVGVDGDGFTADVVTETLARSSLGRRWPRAAASTSSCPCARPTASAATSSRVTSTGWAASSRDRRGGLRAGGSGSRLRPSCCATWSRRARSPSTAYPSPWPRSPTTASPSPSSPRRSQRTTLGAAEPGDPVNLEVDVLAKYVEKLLEGARA